MTPEQLTLLRMDICHTQREFADLLSRLRGAVVSVRTVEGWEMGRREGPVPVYLTDVDAIRRATKPRRDRCLACSAKPVVRKNDQDLCENCASPRSGGERAR